MQLLTTAVMILHSYEPHLDIGVQLPILPAMRPAPGTLAPPTLQNQRQDLERIDADVTVH